MKQVEKVGPTLLHVCATNRPYITGMEGYDELVAATTDNEDTEVLILTAEKEDDMSKTIEETKVALSSENIEDRVAALTDLGIEDAEKWAVALTSPEISAADLSKAKEDAAADATSKLLTALTEAFGSAGAEVKLTSEQTEDTTAALTAVVKTVTGLTESNVALTARLDAAERANVEAEVDALVSEHRILPKSRDAMVEIAMTNREQFDALVPDESIVPLAAQGFEDIEIPGDNVSLTDAKAEQTVEAIMIRNGLGDTKGS